jgi:putative membrane protein
MLGSLLVLLLLLQIDQPYPAVAPLHHLPTLALIVAAPFALRRWPISNAGLACLVLFLALHSIGGRYTYWDVPYDQWSRALFGVSLDEAFDFTRNNYDRFAHFAFGLLGVPPLREVLRRHAGVSSGASLWFAVTVLIAMSALYEMFEWLLTLVAAGPLADDYNGQQGDIWDAQKDMALALAGALISAAFIGVRGSRKDD